MSPIQQMLLGVGAVATKTYIDDIFSTYTYLGTGASRNIVNGINNTKGGLIWTKARASTYSHILVDTERGTNKNIMSSSSSAEFTDANITSFNNNGYGLSDSTFVNRATTPEHVGFNFRKAKGFFTICQWTGDGSSNRQISHSLSSIPGLIMVKKTSESDNWNVYHRSAHATSPEDYRLFLNTSAAASTNDSVWNETKPTSSNFTVGSNDQVNGNGKSYVAYVFAGGESTAATARSVIFTGTSHKLSLAASDDFHLTGDFTIEGWFYPTGSSNEHFWSLGNYTTSGGVLFYIYSNKLYIQEWVSGSRSDRMLMDPAPPQKQWSHIAIVRSGSTINAYVNGTLIKNWTYSDDYGSSSNKTFYIAGSAISHGSVNISNFRVVKGTAVYTSSFKPPTEPLTNITNTKLLCCNNSSATGSTVTPGTITASGVITASTDSPFDDPAGFVVGENEDQNVIKCGSYKGSGSAGLEVNVGFEPSWLMIKVTSRTGDWYIMDSMRGVVTSGNDEFVKANENDAEG